MGRVWPIALAWWPLLQFTQSLCPLPAVSPHSRQRLIFAKGRSDCATPQPKALLRLPSPLDSRQILQLGLWPFLPGYSGFISGHSGSPGTFFPAFHMSACLSVPPDYPPHSVSSTSSSFRCQLKHPLSREGALWHALRPHQLPSPAFLAPLHLFHPHHHSASHVRGAPALPHLITTAQTCLVSITPSAPVTKQELNKHTVDKRIKGRKDKKTVSSVWWNFENDTLTWFWHHTKMGWKYQVIRSRLRDVS